MDTVRILLLISLAFISLLIWDAWKEDRAATIQTPSVELTRSADPDSPLPAITEPNTSSATADNDIPTLTSLPDSTHIDPTAATESGKTLSDGQIVRITTDLLYVEINTMGADIKVADLRTYPVDLDQPDLPFRLMEESPSRTLKNQSGLISASETTLPNHNSPFKTKANSYSLSEDADQLDVSFHWSNTNGQTVTKTYTFHRNSYKVDLRYVIENKTNNDLSLRSYNQFVRSPTAEQSGFSMMPRSFTGAAVYTETNKFQKFDFQDMHEANLNVDTQGGWISFIQHYFVAAWVPPENQTNYLYTKQLSSDRYAVGAASPNIVVKANTAETTSGYYFIGPKEQNRFEGLAEGLPLTVDYGWLTILSEPLFWVLNWINSIIGNWGFSIILVTVLLKLVFYKLNDTSYRSMANMRRVQPEMKALKDRHGSDKQAYNQAMMEFYKKEKINPLGGCLPILVQIPVFIALYWMLLETVEIRQAPFILWIQDLSTKDPYFVLPVLMGISMLIQQKLNPAPMEPIQQKVMMFLPIMFTGFFAFFPSGLVLYWFTNNVLSIAQQWYITNKIEKGS